MAMAQMQVTPNKLSIEKKMFKEGERVLVYQYFSEGKTTTDRKVLTAVLEPVQFEVFPLQEKEFEYNQKGKFKKMIVKNLGVGLVSFKNYEDPQSLPLRHFAMAYDLHWQGIAGLNATLHVLNILSSTPLVPNAILADYGNGGKGFVNLISYSDTETASHKEALRFLETMARQIQISYARGSFLNSQELNQETVDLITNVNRQSLRTLDEPITNAVVISVARFLAEILPATLAEAFKK